MDKTVLDYTESFAKVIGQLRFSIKRLLPDTTLFNKAFYSEFFLDNERNQEAYTTNLDDIGFTFGEFRESQDDDPYRNRILSVLKRGTTNTSIKEFVRFFLEEYFGEKHFSVAIEVRESINDFFDFCKNSSFDTPIRDKLSERLFSIDVIVWLDEKSIKQTPNDVSLKKLVNVRKINSDITSLFEGFISSGVRLNKLVISNGSTSKVIHYAY